MANTIKYPLEISDVVRKQTFCVNSHLSPANPDEGESPLKIFGHWSRYEFCIINEQKKAATANIDFDSMKKILRRADFYFKAHMNLFERNRSGSTTDSIAYTVKLTGRYGGNKSPADVLIENGDKGKSDLSSQKNWLVSNLQKYRKNQEQIDAIDEALRLYDAGKLDKSKASSNSRTIYLATTRPLLRRKAPQFVLNEYPVAQQAVVHPCYEIKITWNLGEQGYPVNITIANYYAPVIRKPDRTINVMKSQRCKADGAMVMNSMNISVDEWMNTIENIQADIDMFRLLYAKKMYTTALKADREIRNSYSSGPQDTNTNDSVQTDSLQSNTSGIANQQVQNNTPNVPPAEPVNDDNSFYQNDYNSGSSYPEWGGNATPAEQSSELNITDDDLPF